MSMMTKEVVVSRIDFATSYMERREDIVAMEIALHVL